MKLNKFLLTILLVIPVYVYAQTEHSRLANSGEIPEDFFRYKDISQIKYDELDIVKSRREKKLFDNFQIENNDYLYRLLHSGFILYSGPIFEYVNQVADKVLSNDKSLRGNVKIYICLSGAVNAFALNSGNIFINIGLIAHLENEAQLAYILTHEIAHYQRKHSFNRYKEYDKIDKHAKELKISDEDDLEFYINHYSREKESEADLLGYEIYKTSGYKKVEAIHALDQLNFAEYPFENRVITKSFFEENYLKIPKSYFPDTASQIVIDEFEDDSLYTHPSTGKRKLSLAKIIDTNDNSGKEFIVSKIEFERVRRECRFELSRVYIFDRDYIASLYNTFLLMQPDSNSLYLNNCLIKSLFLLQSCVNNKNISKLIRNRKKVKGETQKIQYFLSKLSTEEMNVLCLKKAWVIHKKFPNNEEIKAYTLEITKQFEENVSNNLSYFKTSNEYNDSIIASFYITDSTGSAKKLYRGSKTERKKVVKKGSFASYAMCDYMDNVEFVEVFNSLSKSTKSKNNIEEETQEEIVVAAPKAKRKKDVVKTELNRIDNFIIVDLLNMKIDERKKNVIRYVASNNKKQEILSIINTCAQKNNINPIYLNAESLTKNDVDKFNDRSLIEFWLTEKENNNLIKEKINIDYTLLQDLKKRYDTKYVGVISCIGVVLKKDYSDFLYSLFYSIAYPPLFLAFGYEYLMPSTACYINFTIYDIENGKTAFVKSKIYNTNDNEDLIKAEFYNIFFQLAKK